MSRKFKKGDVVLVISGSNKGRFGKVLSLSNDKVVVEGVNIVTVHQKPTSSSAGQIIKMEKPIHISNIAHTENGKAIKVKFILEPGEEKAFARKSRVSKKSGNKIV